VKPVCIEEVSLGCGEGMTGQFVKATGLPEPKKQGDEAGSTLAEEERQHALPTCEEEADNGCSDEEDAIASEITV
jgi:hypothetical protein